MAYVFGHTDGDTQMHLYLWYAVDSADPFVLEKEIIDHLSFIYKNPFKVQNACFNYKSLNMKTTETFSVF